MNMIVIPYRVRTGFYLAAAAVLLALGAMAMPLAMGGRVGPAALLALLSAGGIVFLAVMMGRKRQVVVTGVSVTVPGGPFATQRNEILYRHIQSVHVDRKTGGAYLTLIHRGGTVRVPAACLPKDQGVQFLLDLVSQRVGHTGQQARPMSQTRAAVAEQRRAPVERTFGKRKLAG